MSQWNRSCLIANYELRRENLYDKQTQAVAREEEIIVASEY